MKDFYTWLNEWPDFRTTGQSQDWGDNRASMSYVNGPEYAIRGVRSKYVAQMKSETTKKRKRSTK